jgi:hypothetical protein
MSTTEWRSRIVDHGEASPSSLLSNPQNWREHPKRQEKALEAILDQVGWVRQVIVNRTTGVLVDGHLRVRLAQARGEELIPITYVELDEREERMVLASLDPLASLAATDTAALATLAAQIDPLENKEIAALVRDLAGMQESRHHVPSQEIIDRRSDELEHRFDGQTQRTFECACPHCGHEFAFGR